MKTIISHLLLGFFITVLILLPSLGKTGVRQTTPIESITSVPMPIEGNNILITEPLAHTNILLNQPVFAKEVVLTITFIPKDVEHIAVGIRENSFWLSYEPITFYTRQGAGSKDLQQQTVTIPLTDKLADADQSLDVILFTNSPINIDSFIQNPTQVQVNWELVSFTAQVKNALPSWAATKDFIKSIAYRERVL